MTEYGADQPQESSSGGRSPAVFLFQPHTFRRVTPARLLEWERVMLEHFGLTAEEMTFDDQQVLNGGSWSDSGPAGQICPDDSDNLLDELDLSDYPPESEELPELTRRPAIFMFQPSSFIPVTSDRLAEWEDLMREQVGLTTARFTGKAADSGCLSATLPKDCIDDSDVLEE